VITNFSQYFGLAQEQAISSLPLRIQGIVLAHDFEWNQLYVNDGAATVYFPGRALTNQLAKGQAIELTGVTAWIDGHVSATDLQAKALGTQPLPKPKNLGLSQMADGYGQWVETHGQVRVAETNWGRLMLLLEDGGRSCVVCVLGPPTNSCKELVNCNVRLRAINSSKIHDGLLDAASVVVPDLQEISILEPAATPAPQPTNTIESLLNREPGPWTNSLVHIKGAVVSYLPGRTIIVRDAAATLRAEVAQFNPVLPDKEVEVWGFFSGATQVPVLREAYFALPTRELARVSNVLKLKPSEARQGLPVRLHGVVTYADPERHSGFLQDHGGAVFFDLSQNDVKCGQWVELTGQTDMSRYGPQVLGSSVRVLGETNLPKPAKVDLEDLAYGFSDAHWVELSAVVRRVEAQQAHLTLTLTTPKGKFEATFPDFADQPLPTHFIDARVKVRGVCRAQLNSQDQLSAIRLLVPNFDQIEIIKPAPADPFSLPDTTIGSVAKLDAARMADGRVKVSGVVTLPMAGDGLFLEEATGAIRVRTSQTNQLEAGDLAEVVGFPALTDGTLCLEEAAFRKTGTGSLPAPIVIAAEELLQETNASRRVRVKARLLQRVVHSARPRLVLQDGPVIFPAIVQSPTASPDLTALKPGSLIQVAGICLMQGRGNHEPTAFRLLVAQSGDIKLLRAPPWWSLRNTLMVGGGLTLGLAAAFAWILSLRTQVKRRTRELHEEIAQHKRTEEALRSSDRFLRSLLESLPQNIIRKDLQGRFTFANQVFARTVGKPVEQVLGKTDFDLFPQALAAKYRQDDAQVISSGKLFETVEENRTASGEKTFVHAVKTPFYDSEHRPAGLQIVFWDVTARKAAEAELAYERDLFRTLVDNLPDSIYFKDVESRFVRVGRAKLKRNFQTALDAYRFQHAPEDSKDLPPHLAGLEPFAAYLIGKTDFDFYTEDRAREAFEDEQHIIRTGKPLIGKLECLRHLDGKVTWCLTTKMLWLDKDGHRLGTFGISSDVTSIKEAEAKLESANRQLVEISRQAGMAEVATSVLHNVGNVLNSANVSANLLADKLRDSTVGQLSKVAALLRQHESDLGSFLRQDAKGKQLAAYVSQLAEHLAAEQAASLDELREFVNHIDHIKEIVVMQQNYAKICGVAEKVQVTDLVEDALRLNATALERHHVCVRRDFSPRLPEITVEKHKVLQILVNLISNAKHACEDAPCPRRQLAVVVANGEGCIKITISDNGVGIAPENLSRIFNHGFTTRKNGHGFGLHSGALAAKELGGSLRAQSNGLGQGATFTLELPLLPGEQS
jgi:PAS domain S-box-containing protein